jgi:arabinogalactan endo-1,4-beta-galactosidase
MHKIVLSCFLAALSQSCFAAKETVFAKGADVGWLSEMEAAGTKFYDKDGHEKDCLQILHDAGINAIRLRVWVNPAKGWCNPDDVVKMAKRASGMGFRILIDFHYADNWADPQHQPKPAAWQNDHGPQLAEDVYAHTKSVLEALKAAGVTPEWVQVGNEITFGMLWPDAKSKNFEELVACINRGYDAVKEVDPDTQVIIHLNNGADNQMFRGWFDHALKLGVKFDVIGLSFYPEAKDWQKMIDHCVANMADLIPRYGKPVMICEIGYYDKDPQTTKEILTQMIAKTRALPDRKGLGLFYWEPEGFTQGYNRSAWGKDGKPTAAMDAFAN